MFLRGFSFRVTHDDKVNVSEKWVMALVWCHGFSFLTAGLDNSKVKENSVNSLLPSGRTLDRRAAGNTGIGAMRAGRIRSSKNKTPFDIIRAGHCCGAAQRQYPAVMCHWFAATP